MGATKKCTKCGKIKSLREFGKHRGTKDNLRHVCKECNRASAREYRTAHRAACQAREREYRKAHRAEIQARDRAYYAAHSEQKRAYTQQYYANNKKDARAAKTVRIKRAKAWHAEYLKSCPCSACGRYTKRRAHHHLDKKNHNVSYLVEVGYPIPRIEAEIELCVVLCTSCHTKLHAAERKRAI